MKKKTLNTKQGFTIIEVVLVLAIAGLIFLMVFVAFPALQRNQRDTQRRQDYANLSAAVISKATNNNGTFPSSLSGTDINKDGKDPGGGPYTISVIPTDEAVSVSDLGVGRVYVVQRSQCIGGEPKREQSNTSKQFTIYGYTESGPYCLNGQL